MSEVKETNYFATDFPHLQKVTYQSVEDYHLLFRNASSKHMIAGEASPFYMFSKVAFENMKAYEPNAKVILVLRNPVDFIQSYHQLNLSLLREDVTDLGQAWDLYDVRKQGKHIPPSARQPELVYYQEMGCFAKHVRHLYAIFPQEQIRIYLFDELVTSPKNVYEDILSFIGIPSDGRVDFPRVNAGFVVKSSLMAKILHPPQFIYKPFMNLIGLFGPKMMKNIFLLYDRLEHLNTSESKRQKLPPELRARMLAYFRPDIEQLARLLQRDLSHWLV